MPTMAVIYNKARRAQLVKRGLCGWCGEPRNTYDWLCDDCAAKHRAKQQAKRPSTLSEICKSWTLERASE